MYIIGKLIIKFMLKRLKLTEFIKLNEMDFKLAAGLTPRERETVENGGSLIPKSELPSEDIDDTSD